MPEDRNIADQSKYPSGQAPRTPGQPTIIAEKFRVADVMKRNDPDGTRSRPPKKPS
jgi:hypothetical protein